MEYQHLFTCFICKNKFYSVKDEECLEEFVKRYGHLPEETTDDELVSICDNCYNQKVEEGVLHS
jgi:hypothetical protein